MPEESVTVKDCRALRDKIYGMIFPRWVLMSIGGVFITLFLVLYMLNGKNAVAASDAMKKAEIGEVRMEHLKEGQTEIKDRLTAQQTILQRIDRKVNGD